MRILQFNKDEVYIGRLKNIITMDHTEEINGENSVALTTLSSVNKNDRLVYSDKEDVWHEFIVRNVAESREGNVLIREVFAEHSISETIGDYIVDQYLVDEDATTALTTALAPTRWSIGTVNVNGTNTLHMYNTSSRTAIQDVLELWGGEIRFRIVVTDHRVTGRFVDLVTRRGVDLNRRFSYNKNLDTVTKTVNDDDVITALYGFGKGENVVEGAKEYNKRLDFATINGGKAYVENNTAKNIWGRGQNGSKQHVFAKVEYDDCEDKAELLKLTQDRLAEVSQPNITYEASIFDLARLDNRYDIVGLGDTIQIIDREFTPELRLSARAIKLVQNLVDDTLTQVTLGNFAPSLSDVFNTQGQQLNSLRNRPSGGGGSSIINSVNIPDTRAVINKPGDLFTKSMFTEFKSRTSVGSPPVGSDATYAFITTISGWSDYGGGYPIQVSWGKTAIAIRQGETNDTWSPWTKIGV